MNIASNQTAQLQARKLRWWNHEQLSSLAAHLALARARWQQAWIDDYSAIAADETAVHCVLAHEYASDASGYADAKTAFEFQRDSTAAPTPQEVCRLWISRPEDLDETLSSILLSTSPLTESSSRKSVNVADLAAAAFEDCLNEIKMALTPNSRRAENGMYRTVLNADIPDEHRRRWSGGVCVSFPLYRDLHLSLHISPDLAALLLVDEKNNNSTKKAVPASTALVPLLETLGDQPVNFRAELSPVELSLGHLQSLAIGDVLLLPHPLTQALEVKDALGASLCSAYLGKSNGNRAIELIRPASAKMASSL